MRAIFFLCYTEKKMRKSILILLVLISAAYACAESISSFTPQRSVFETQQLMHIGTPYCDAVYPPFAYASPSGEGITSAVSRPGQPRTFIKPGESGRSVDCPLRGEWGLALFAVLYVCVKACINVRSRQERCKLHRS